MSEAAETAAVQEKPVSPLREIVQPFVDLVHAPRALWGINVTYFLEGFVYFGILTYLSFYFSDYVGLSDTRASWMVGVLTSGITLSMAVLGGASDRWGVRRALIAALALMVLGRVALAAAPSLGLAGGGLASPLNLAATGGLLLVVLGYGMYQPAAYAGVKQFTTEKTAAMGYAMLYALMNLGGWLPSFAGFVRERVGILGTMWVYAGLTVLGVLLTAVLLTRSTVQRTLDEVRRQREQEAGGKPAPASESKPSAAVAGRKKALLERVADAVGEFFRTHPLADAKFSFFIFCLIPVQTLFAHNWLTLPKYVERAYAGTWVGEKFEFAVNFNPLLIFILVPIVAAMTRKANVYKMMIFGTLVMAAPTFLLSLGTHPALLLAYIVLSTVGEAIWQPRFLQYAAEIAPEGKTGIYMGVAQLPWFLTKMIVAVYAGWFLERFVPKDGPMRPEAMWFIYALIAVSSTVMLVLARHWLGKDFKTKAAG